jgi:hypothetical protein
VLTNLHVIENATAVSVKLANGDVYDDVSVLAFDARRDLVLLKVAGFALKSVTLGNSDTLKVGDRVYAIGAPRGLELTISEGIVSAIRDSGEGYQVIQTTAPISPGSSGGGLFDNQGHLVGLTTYRLEGGENLNFAVPINYARGMARTNQMMTLAELRTNIETRSLTGVLPTNFTFKARALSCDFRRLERWSRLLHVQFVRNGRSIKEGSTSNPDGRVSLSVKESPSPLHPPYIEGYTPDLVRAILGDPTMQQTDFDGVVTWYYDTPDGTLKVFMYWNQASLRRQR